MTIERAIEILDPEHREHYDSIEPVNEACRIGMNALKELAELKARLEYCLVVDMPCKIGDTAYWINGLLPYCIKEYKVRRYVFDELDSVRVDLGNLQPVLFREMKNKKLFFDREQAEARLKELQEGKK